MTLVKWTPKRNVMSLFDDVENMVHQAFNHSVENDDSSLSYRPLMNVSETESDYLVMMDLPGIEKNDVDVNVSSGMLTITGERKLPKHASKKSRIWHEIFYGTFSRSFELTSDIIEGKIKATFKDGVLSIAIPKAEVAKSVMKKIAIN